LRGFYSGASRGDRLVLIATAAADTNGADDRSVTPQADATGEIITRPWFSN